MILWTGQGIRSEYRVSEHQSYASLLISWGSLCGAKSCDNRVAKIWKFWKSWPIWWVRVKKKVKMYSTKDYPFHNFPILSHPIETISRYTYLVLISGNVSLFPLLYFLTILHILLFSHFHAYIPFAHFLFIISHCLWDKGILFPLLQLQTWT